MSISDFTYDAYKNLLHLIKDNGYRFTDYHDDNDMNDKVCIMRHDIDFDIDKALALASIENQLNVKSTYFVLLKTDFYNPCSAESIKKLNGICKLGHEIGLHFDEVSYDAEINTVSSLIEKEADCLGTILGKKITTVSMHRPSEQTLEANYVMKGIVNSYSQTYFKQYKYLSDSRHRWREDVEGIVASRAYQQLHILTHPFWYAEQETSMHDVVKAFCLRGSRDRYECLSENMRDLQEVLTLEELEGGN